MHTTKTSLPQKMQSTSKTSSTQGWPFSFIRYANKTCTYISYYVQISCICICLLKTQFVVWSLPHMNSFLESFGNGKLGDSQKGHGQQPFGEAIMHWGYKRVARDLWCLHKLIHLRRWEHSALYYIMWMSIFRQIDSWYSIKNLELVQWNTIGMNRPSTL